MLNDKPKTVTCSVCFGRGQRGAKPCPACQGTGKIVVPAPVLR